MEHLSESLIATLRESLLVLDDNLRVIKANRSFYRTFQVEISQVEGRLLHELGNGQWNIAPLLLALEEVVTQKVVVEDLEVEHFFPQIGHKVMMLNARCVERESGAAPLILLAIDDVTQQHEASATIQKYLRHLEVSNRELEDFAYVASHDLQEPLRAIQAFSDRLRNKHAATLDEQGIDYLVRIQKAAGRMRQLISDLLTYSRVTTQGKPFERVNLAKIASECIADLTLRLDETCGHIEVGDLPSLDADPVQMRQLLQNLLDNGLKFHREEATPRVKITGHRMAPPGFEVPEGTAPGNPFCFISVQDNGIGFDQKYADRIFSPFERLHNQNQFPGTGIGLAVCRRIVERHGGSLTAKSVLGQGTTFFIALPVQQSQKDALQQDLTEKTHE